MLMTKIFGPKNALRQSSGEKGLLRVTAGHNESQYGL